MIDLEMLDILNSIPNSVTEEIDILNGATEDFICEVAKLESITNLQARSQEALKYINANDYITMIDYNILGSYLTKPTIVSLDTWRQLYLLNASIPPRNASRSWLNRLRLFYNTFLIEHGIVNKKYAGHKLYFTTKLSGDHENLHVGEGKPAPDFYFYENGKVTLVELKYCRGSLETEVLNYIPENRNHTYGARFVILFNPTIGYNMVNYKVSPPSIEKLDAEVPTGLLDIK